MDPQFRAYRPIDRLHQLSEECGEVVAAIGKTLRFGTESFNPYLKPEDRETNIDWVKREVNDLKLAIENFEQYYGAHDNDH